MHTCAIPVRASSRQPQHCRLSSPAVAGTHFSRQQLELPRLQGSGRHARAPVQAGVRAHASRLRTAAPLLVPREAPGLASARVASPRDHGTTRGSWMLHRPLPAGALVLAAATAAAADAWSTGAVLRIPRAPTRAAPASITTAAWISRKKETYYHARRRHERVRASPASGDSYGCGEGLKGLKSRRDGRRPSRLLWRRSAQQRGSLPGSRGAPMRAGSHADDTVCQHSASARAARGGDGCRSGDRGEGRPALSCAWHSFARAIS